MTIKTDGPGRSVSSDHRVHQQGYIAEGTQTPAVTRTRSTESAQTPLASRAATNLVGATGAESTGVTLPGVMDVRVKAPAKKGNAKQYIVMVQPDRVAGEKAAMVKATIDALRRTQTERQRLLSNESRNRLVLFLNETQAAKLKDAGVIVFPDHQIEIPRLQGSRSSDLVAQGAPLGRKLHGVDKLGAGFAGEGVMFITIDTGIAPHPDLPEIARFDNVFTPEPEDEPQDLHGHGTHVSGIAVAKGDPEAGSMRGMAPKATLTGVQVLDGDGSGSWSSVMAGVERAIEWAQQHDGPVVINLSLGGPSSDPENDPLNLLLNEAVTQHGIFVSVAAGNTGPSEGTIGTPGTARDVLTVGAMDQRGDLDPANDRIADFSSRGMPDEPGQEGKPNLSAHGVNVLSTVPWGYERWSGTSMAAPNVGGGGAVLLGKAWKLYKDGALSTDPRELIKSGEFQALLFETARDNPDVDWHTEGAGDLLVDKAADMLMNKYGRLHVKQAVQEFEHVVKSHFEDDGRVLLEEVDETIVQLLDPELSGTLETPQDKIDYLAGVKAFFEEMQANPDDGMAFCDRAAVEIRGLMNRFATAALLERAQEPFETPDDAVAAFDALVGWAKEEGGVDSGEIHTLKTMIAASCEQLTADGQLGYLSTIQQRLQADLELAGIDEARSALHPLAYDAVSARSKEPMADAAQAFNLFGTHTGWQSSDADLSPAAKTRARAKTISASLRQLVATEQVAYLAELRSCLETERDAGNQEARVLIGQVQHDAIAAHVNQVELSEPFDTGAAAAAFLAGMVKWQVADGTYDTDDKLALTAMLVKLVRGGSCDPLLTNSHEKNALLRDAKAVFDSLHADGYLTKGEVSKQWQRLSDAVNEQVRTMRQAQRTASSSP